ncbi:MAG: hypothetical protein U1D70_19515, partial [Methylobacter sp.]|nr:hypothetical protein [Methylobacter sp.]
RAIREWLGLVQVEIINRPDEGSAHDWLHSSAIMRVVSELLECSFVKWDGANHVGALGTVGDMLFCDLVEGVNELPDNDWSVWGADEWLDMSTDLELGLMPGMTEVQIDSLAESHVTGALADHVLLYGTVEFLQSRVRGMDGYND